MPDLPYTWHILNKAPAGATHRNRSRKPPDLHHHRWFAAHKTKFRAQWFRVDGVYYCQVKRRPNVEGSPVWWGDPKLKNPDAVQAIAEYALSPVVWYRVEPRT